MNYFSLEEIKIDFNSKIDNNNKIKMNNKYIDKFKNIDINKLFYADKYNHILLENSFQLENSEEIQKITKTMFINKISIILLTLLKLIQIKLVKEIGLYTSNKNILEYIKFYNNDIKINKNVLHKILIIDTFDIKYLDMLELDGTIIIITSELHFLDLQNLCINFKKKNIILPKYYDEPNFGIILENYKKFDKPYSYYLSNKFVKSFNSYFKKRKSHLKEIYKKCLLNNIDSNIIIYNSYQIAKYLDLEVYHMEDNVNITFLTILENMYSLDNSVFIKLKNHDNLQINLQEISNSDVLIPKEINIYNKLRFKETNQIDTRSIDKWDMVKKEIRYYESTLNKKLLDYEIKIGNNMPVSRAWIKFYEILFETKIYDMIKGDINAFHICEAPGTFIHSTIFYLKKWNKESTYIWEAMTIDPKITTIGDTYKLIQNNPNKWTFNDITKESTIKYYNKICKTKDFIIGDCGIAYEEDDSNAVLLFYSQMLFILFNLKENGCCIFKQIINFKFKILIDMLFIIFNSFKKIICYKPIQNLFSNEFYIICFNYKPIINNFDLLFDILNKKKINNSIIKEYTDDFLYQFTNALNKLITNFNYAIERQLYYTDNWNLITKEHKKKIKYMIDIKNKDWIEYFILKE